MLVAVPWAAGEIPLAKWAKQNGRKGSHLVPQNVSVDWRPSDEEHTDFQELLETVHKKQPNGAPGYRGGEVPWSSEGDDVGGSTHSQVWVAVFSTTTSTARRCPSTSKPTPSTHRYSRNGIQGSTCRKRVRGAKSGRRKRAGCRSRRTASGSRGGAIAGARASKAHALRY